MVLVFDVSPPSLVAVTLMETPFSSLETVLFDFLIISIISLVSGFLNPSRNR